MEITKDYLEAKKKRLLDDIEDHKAQLNELAVVLNRMEGGVTTINQLIKDMDVIAEDPKP